MILKYENTIEDLVEFNRYHLWHSPSTRKIKYVSIFFWSLFIVGFASLIPGNTMFTKPQNVAFGIILAAVVCWFIYRGFDKERVKQFYSENGENGLIGEVELELSLEGITERREGSTSTISWKFVNKIVETDEHIFIYVTPVSGHAIPKNSIRAGILDQFVDQAKKFWLAAHPQESIES